MRGICFLCFIEGNLIFFQPKTLKFKIFLQLIGNEECAERLISDLERKFPTYGFVVGLFTAPPIKLCHSKTNFEGRQIQLLDKNIRNGKMYLLRTGNIIDMYRYICIIYNF